MFISGELDNLRRIVILVEPHRIAPADIRTKYFDPSTVNFLWSPQVT